MPERPNDGATGSLLRLSGLTRHPPNVQKPDQIEYIVTEKRMMRPSRVLKELMVDYDLSSNRIAKRSAVP